MNLAQELARRLGLITPYIINVADSASHQYRSYWIPKAAGGYRRIDHPTPELKALQRALVRFHIKDWPVHESAKAYRPGFNNILANATQHAASCYLLRMDFQEFFPSIKAEDVAHYLSIQKPDWNSDDINLFVRLVCRKGRLTIGAPSSPGLSNALCFELDRQLSRIAENRRVTYTRYADDLFFSTRERNVLSDIPSAVEDLLTKLPCPSKLWLNKSKTRHSSKRGRRRVTGLILGSDEKVHIGRSRKRKVRAMMHNLFRLTPTERSTLAGMLAFCRDVDPDFINGLVLKYGHERLQSAVNSGSNPP